jgi:hypothetical protein
MKHSTTAAQKPSGLAGLASTAIESIQINSITLETRQRRTLLVKHRRWGSELLATIANLFFWLSRSPIHVWVRPGRWLRWEIKCFRLLYSGCFQIFAEGSRTLYQERFRGESLMEHLHHRTLDVQAIRAAARELRRAHGLRCNELGGFWSHGDPHLGNIVYDEVADRARLVDFEIIHDKRLSAVERHADDLLVLLQDLVGRVSEEEWLPLTICFVEAYGQEDVIAELTKKLVVPGGIAGIWWKLRTQYLSRRELVCRFTALRQAVCNHLVSRNVLRQRREFEPCEPWLKTA